MNRIIRTSTLFLLAAALLLLAACGAGGQQEAENTLPVQTPQAAQEPDAEPAQSEIIEAEQEDDRKPDESEDDESDYNEEEPGWRVYYNEAAMKELGWTEAEKEGDCILALDAPDGGSLRVTVRWIGSITAEEYFAAQQEAFFGGASDGTEESWETPWGYEGRIFCAAGGTAQLRCSYLEGFGIEILIGAEGSGAAQTIGETAECFFDGQFDIYAAG